MTIHTHTGTVAAPQLAPAAPSAVAVAVLRQAGRARRRRTAYVIGTLGLAWLAAFVVRVLLGDYTITVPDFWRIVTGTEIPGASFILMESTLPRAVVGTLAGLALGASGATFQTMARNPLASPDVLGITMGASAAAVFTLVVLGGSSGAVTVAALLGAGAVALALVTLSGTGPGGAPYRMILVGVALAAMLASVVHWVLLQADVYLAHEAMVWLTGTLSSATWPEIWRLGVVVAFTLPALLLVARQLQVVELGDDLAQGLGEPPAHVRTRAVALVVVLTAVTTSVCGPIAFVAFLAGQIARQLLGGRSSVAAAALVGAVVVVAADHVAAYAVPDVNLPVGVVTGVLGAPVLLWLLAAGRTTRQESS
ncbi:FecCD family ABC transporter permease [Ornithinimicrobium sediminis]|uniref:FecCD family ABC transporter permease n=1 Tax=Ornithinimicrobium sediminis TaxID=2904603 RepID=UPI001E40543B|nr:iron ABC transporter permease [Ornithinimicrobium sediminis]MCE0487148.1 iron ABC transporter permease [Ornithinimicrobium sediminis]